MIQWYMKYWFYVSHIPDQIRIWKCCFVRRQEKNKDKPPKVPFPGFLSHSDRILASFIHSFIHEALSIADYFIKVWFPYCSGYKQERIRFQHGNVFLPSKIYLLLFIMETGVDPCLPLHHQMFPS